MNRFFAVKKENSVTVNFNGEIRVFTPETEEEMQNLMNLCRLVKANDPAAVQEMTNRFDPSYRQPVLKELEKSESGNYYLKGFNIPIPLELVDRIRDYVKHDYPITALVNFWKLLMLNPDEHVRKDLFSFADRFAFPITDKGYFIAYKSVAWAGVKNMDRALRITNAYVHEKANGHNPADMIVISDSEDETRAWIGTQEEYEAMVKEAKEEWLFQNNLVNRLLDAYPELDTVIWDDGKERTEVVKRLAAERNIVAGTEADFDAENTLYVESDLETAFQAVNNLLEVEGKQFTDWHSHTTEIKLGQPVAMPREDCDNDPNNTCSAGLHVGAPGYVRSFGGGRDNYIIACLVNPADVVAVPYDYDFEKMRTSKYFPYALVELDENQKIKEIDTPYFESDYADFEMNELDAKLQELYSKSTRGELTEEDKELNEMLQKRLIDLRD